MAVDEPSLLVTVLFSPAERVVDQRVVSLALGTTVGDAVTASGMVTSHPELAPIASKAPDGDFEVGVWGRLRSLDFVLRPGDRVEIYRPLRVDPMDARRRRHKEQKASAR